MFFRSDGWVKSVLGQAIAGAQIYVCNQPADVAFLPPLPQAEIFSDPEGLSPITQPIFSDGFGHYDFYVPYGTYTLVVVTGGNIQATYPDQTIGFSVLGGSVTSVFGRTGTVVAAFGDYTVAQILGAAPTASPTFTGIPIAPTAPFGTSSAQLATTNFVIANALHTVGAVFTGGGSPLLGTYTACILIPYACTILNVSLIADQTGNATVGVGTVSYAAYTGASSASSITAADTPALSSAIKYQDTTLTGWTTAVAANTVMCFTLSSPSAVTTVTITLTLAG